MARWWHLAVEPLPVGVVLEQAMSPAAAITGSAAVAGATTWSQAIVITIPATRPSLGVSRPLTIRVASFSAPAAPHPLRALPYSLSPARRRWEARGPKR